MALAFSVHLINESALGEFSAAVRQVGGQPDFELRAQREGFDESLFARVATHPAWRWPAPVIELDAQAFDAEGKPLALRVSGSMRSPPPPLTPALLPLTRRGRRPARRDRPDGRLPECRRGPPPRRAATLRLRVARQRRFAVRGSVLADGPPLAVLDLAGAQQAASAGWAGISRIDVRLVPGTDREALLRELRLPAGVRAAAPDESQQRVSNVSRAYRVNLTVLALVALFTGAFLVFSILSLSVARRRRSWRCSACSG